MAVSLSSASAITAKGKKTIYRISGRSDRISSTVHLFRKRNLEGNLILQRHRSGPWTQRCVP